MKDFPNAWTLVNALNFDLNFIHSLCTILPRK